MPPVFVIMIALFFNLFMAQIVVAAEVSPCRKVIFADTGWSDVTATTAVATTLLQGLGYETAVKPLTLPAIYPALATNDVHVFLGHWSSVMDSKIKPYRETGTIDIIRPNLSTTRYGLAVNKAGHALGIRSIGDIREHRQALNGKIHGVKPDNSVNFVLQKLIAENVAELGTFEIVEHSEQGFFAQLERKKNHDEPALFIAWEPHPLNNRTEPIFLTDSDDLFGSESEKSEVQTITSAGFSEACPNISKFLHNLHFTEETENFLIDEIFVKDSKPDMVAKRWISANSTIVTEWLTDVVSANGNDPQTTLNIFLDE